MIKLPKKLERFRPYLKIAVDLYPKKLKKLNRCYVITPSVTKKHKIEGICHRYHDDGTFEIGIYLRHQKIIFKGDNVEITLGNYSTMELLYTLAHELAHCIVWNDDHTIRHERITIRLYGKFLTQLKKEGYISQEDEAKNPFVRKVNNE